MRNPYKIKPNENHPKQKCIFWGYPNQIPFPKILRSSDFMNIFFVAIRHAVAAQSAAYSAPEGGMIMLGFS